MPPFDLNKAKEDLDRAIELVKQNKNDEKNRQFFGTLIQSIGGIMSQTLGVLIENNKQLKEEFKSSSDNLFKAIKSIKIENTVNVPEIKVPEANVKVEVPTLKAEVPKAEVVVKQEPINIPEIKTAGIESAIEKSIEKGFKKIKIEVPEIELPPFPQSKLEFPVEMDVKGWIKGYDRSLLDNPFPVQIRDTDGKPVNLLDGLTRLTVSGGGGKSDYLTIKKILETVPISSGASLEVKQVSGANDSVNVTQWAGDALAKGTELNSGVLRTYLVADAAYSVRAIANSGVDIGDVDVTSQVVSSFDHGSNRDIDTAAEQLTTTSMPAKFGVTIVTPLANTGIVYVGNSDVTAGTTDATDGFPLNAGDQKFFAVDNANKLYVIGSALNQIAYFFVE